MTELAIHQQMQALTQAVNLIAASLGTRLTRAELCERIGIHRNTLTTWLQTDRHFPRPGKDGKWLLVDVMKWEQRASEPSQTPSD